jgi:hypothetical protein
MRKLLLAAAACALLAMQAHADKISDSFSEFEGTWCFLRSIDKDITEYTRLNPKTKKPCTRGGNTDWITINNVATFSGSEHTCLAIEGGDYRKIGNHMMFKFKYRCTGEGYKWSNVTSLRISDTTGNLQVLVDK